MLSYGDTVPLGIEVRDAAGALTNAATNVLTVRLPDGTTATPATTNPSTGLYACLYVPAQAGNHEWSWVTTTPATGQEGSFDVSAAFPGLILSLPEAKAFLNIRPDDTDQDDEIRAMIEGVTAVVEGGDGRDFPGVGPVVRRTVTRTIYPNARVNQFALPETEILSITTGTYVSDSSPVDLTGWVFDSGVLRSPYQTWLPTTPWVITYVVGRPSLPASIRMGALEILKDAWASQRNADDSQPFMVSARARGWLGSEQQVLGFA